MGLTRPAVPYVGSNSPVSGCALSVAVHFWLCRLNASGCAMRGRAPPRDVIALRFLEPKTAPSPARPAARSPLNSAAYRTRFSPAGPITSAPAFAGSLAASASCTSDVRMPHRSPASPNVTSPSAISRCVGAAARPVITSASTPAFLRYVPNGPPQLDDATIPVSGESAETSNRAVEGAPVPVSGPVATTMTFSGPSGSVPSASVSARMRAAMTLPPR